MSFFRLLILICFLATTLEGEEIKVLLNADAKSSSNALIVLLPEKLVVAKGQTTIPYKILNRSDEDVFVVIESRHVAGWEHLEGPRGEMFGGGSLIGQPSTHENLRVLFSPRREEDGSVTSGEDEMTSATVAEVKVDCGHGKDLSDWVGSRGKLPLFLNYYVGSSKGRRSVPISVPIRIETGEEAAEGEGKKVGG